MGNLLVKNMDIDEIVNSLSSGEIKLLKYMKEKRLYEASEESIADDMKTPLSEISRSALWLENKGLAKRVEEKVKVYTITDKGKQYIDKPLPEETLAKYLREVGDIELKKLRSANILDAKELDAAIGTLIRHGIIKIEKKNGEKIVKVLKSKIAEITPTQKAFNLIIEGKFDLVEKNILKDFLKRGLIRESIKSVWKVKLTRLGKKILEIDLSDIQVIEKITSEVIRNREWLKKRIRWYDVTSPLPKTWGGRKHPLRVIMERIREIFVEMGFKEMYGPWVELAFWNMDSMFIPQDHPAREMQATFYLDKPSRGFVQDRRLVNLVKEVQENGYDTGSLGWRQPWSEDEAMRVLLRTHTTAITFRVLGKLIRGGKIKPPVKFFAIGRVFRNEAIDWKHLAEFHQVEGFVIAKGLTLRSLMGYIREFYYKMGIKKLRFKPTYNPYTEPSMEIFAWHKDVGKWVEVGNSGIFRPETLRPYNINLPVIAWGLAVERLAAIIYGIEDIRKLIGPMVDIDWMRWYRIPKIEF